MKTIDQTFAIQTLGCKVNQYESEAIACNLVEKGLTAQSQNAAIAIINTCTVTQKAGMQSRQLIRQAIRNHPGALIIATGCHAQVNPGDIQSIEGVHWVVGHAFKHTLPDRICQLFNARMVCSDQPEIFISNILEHTTFNHMAMSHLQKRSRPVLKIQDGCHSFCSYCIVPYARGPSRSLPVVDVVNAVTTLKSSGYHETILSGIHLGMYGRDLDPPIQLIDLLQQLVSVPDCPRIRLSSIEPIEITDQLVRFIQQTPRMCHHLHIPLQSGDNAVLKHMNRHYTPQFFQGLVENIHNRIPDIAIGIDVLVGFPGESNLAFENTFSLLEHLPAAYFHVFPFSRRAGTHIADNLDPVPVETIKARAKAIRELGKRKRLAFYQASIGQEQWAVVESFDGKYSKGLTGNYIPVRILGKFEKHVMIPVYLKDFVGESVLSELSR